MCSTCGVIKNPNLLINKVTNKESYSCIEKKEEIETLYKRILCFRQKKDNFQSKQWLGYILTMINLKNYCKYDLTLLKNLLDEYSC